MEKAFSKFETHFKIIYNIYPVAEFLNRRFHLRWTFVLFVIQPVKHCNTCFFFFMGIHNWLSLKINSIPEFVLSHVTFYMDTLHPSVSDVINILILWGKYIHCSKWRNSKPSVTWLVNDFKQYFMSLKKLKCSKSVRIFNDISQLLLFWFMLPVSFGLRSLVVILHYFCYTNSYR